jgi:Bacterial protein of unknown function (Gcw_chp)
MSEPHTPDAPSRTLTAIAAASVAALSFTGTANAEDAPLSETGRVHAGPHDLVSAPLEAPSVNTGKIALSAGFDVVTEYWYRGIGQENQGLILQPWLDLTFELFASDDLTLTGSIGTWNSIQDATPGDAWYESDFYAGVTAEMGNLSLGASYINLYNPAGGDIFTEEIDFSLAYDDSDMGLPFALNPSIVLAFEIDGGSDNGTNKGTYLQLAIEPVFENILKSDSLKVDASLPVTLGLGLEDYYEDGAGNDDTFGFFDVGIMFSTPLDNLIPADYGAWSASIGVHYLFLGDSAQNISSAFGTGNDSSSVYAIFGITMEY